MPIAGYVEYKPRTFCNDVKCPVQMALNSKNQNSEEFAKIKKECEKCRFSAREFHHWLKEKEFIIVRRKKFEKD